MGLVDVRGMVPVGMRLKGFRTVVVGGVVDRLGLCQVAWNHEADSTGVVGKDRPASEAGPRHENE